MLLYKSFHSPFLYERVVIMRMMYVYSTQHVVYVLIEINYLHDARKIYVVLLTDCGVVMFYSSRDPKCPSRIDLPVRNQNGVYYVL